MLSKVDFCAQVSGRDVDKSALFDVFYGELKTAPLIEQCPINLECLVVKEFAIQHRQVLIAEVREAHVSPQYVTDVDGRPEVMDIGSLDPILFALNNRYYRIGAALGVASEEADELLKSYGLKT